MVNNNVNMNSKRASETAVNGASSPIDINYTVQTQSRPSNAGTSKAAMAIAKPAMIGAGLLALGTVALGIFDIFRVPGLEEQIRELEAEVDRLEDQVDRLEDLNDDYEMLNQDLNESLAELANTTAILNASAVELADQVFVLNQTERALNKTAEELKDNAEEYEQLNQELNQTQQDLQEEIVYLGELEENFTQTNAELVNRTAELSVEVAKLDNITTGLQESVDELDEQVQNLTASNARLAITVNELTVVAEYMGSTYGDFSQALDDVETALDGNINLNRANVFFSLNNYYDDLRTRWWCREFDMFNQYAFWDNQTFAPIWDSGPEVYGVVFSVAKERFLELMCLSSDNFQAYLSCEVANPLEITYTSFKEGASVYGRMAMDFYNLPITAPCDVDGGCVTAEEWEAGGFECKNVDEYVYVKPATCPTGA